MTAAVVGREFGRSATAWVEAVRSFAGEAGIGRIAVEEEGLHIAAGRRVADRKVAGIAGEGEGLGCSRTAV